jgi:hypothetical protein
MALSWFSRLWKRPGTPTRPATVRKFKSFRPQIDVLEERQLMAANVLVVPLAVPVDGTHFHSLSAAMTAAGTGGSVTIEPGAIPDGATVFVNLDNLTIQGDPNVPGSTLPSYNITITGAHFVTLNNLNLGVVNLNPGTSFATISHCQVHDINESLGNLSITGHNTISQNQISGALNLDGCSGIALSTHDLIANNTFISHAPVVLTLSNSAGTEIRDNTFLDDALGGQGIRVLGNTDNVVIANNKITLTSPFAAIYLQNINAANDHLAVTVSNNVFNTGGKGTGIIEDIFSGGTNFFTRIEGNDFRDNLVGVEVIGKNNTPLGGKTDLGAGISPLGTSLGGNDFRGFDGKNQHFAVGLYLTDSNAYVPAAYNIFDAGVVLSQVVQDQKNGGTGNIGAGLPLNANQAFVETLYEHLLGRTANPFGGNSELNLWVGQLPVLGQAGVANAILHSPEALGRIVDGYYMEYLGRAADQAGKQGWVTAIQNGMSLEAVQAAFLSSPEFVSHANTDYVQALYLHVLHRTGSAAELATWNNVLPVVGLSGVAAGFTSSLENRQNAITSYYESLLHREPSAAELATWAKVPGDLLTLEAAILASSEFFMNG